jgi:dolichol kinase
MKISELELRRQLFHLIFGTSLVILIYFDIIGIKVLSLILFLGLIISMVSRYKDIPLISWFLNKFDRKDTRFPGEGAFFLILGTALVIAIFPKTIALASLLILAFGDSFAHLLGKAYGKKRFAHKTAFGTLSGIFFGFLGALIFVDPVTALLGSGFSMFFEAFNLKFLKSKVDDNLFIPVVSSIIMYIWVIL